jgi:hypothetical protein
MSDNLQTDEDFRAGRAKHHRRMNVIHALQLILIISLIALELYQRLT